MSNPTPTESLPPFGQYTRELLTPSDEELPSLDALDDMLTDAAGLLDHVAQHLAGHRHAGVMSPGTASLVGDQAQVAWATVKGAQSLLRDLIALQTPRA